MIDKLIIPDRFLAVPYNAAIYPGVTHPSDLSTGANCQVFAYALLAHFGIDFPPLRSSDLWADVDYSSVVANPAPLDLLLFNRTADPYAAHVAVCVGQGRAIHLARAVGFPTEWSIEEFSKRPDYAVFIGAKRPRA